MSEFNNKYTFDKNSLPGIGHALLLIIAGALISLAFSPVMKILLKSEVLKDWAILISYLVTIGSVLFISIKIFSHRGFEFNPIAPLLYLLLIPLVASMSIIAEGIVGLIPMPEAIEQLFASMVQLDVPGYLTIGIAAPILEELIFRGVVLKRFLEKYNPQKAIFWSAFIFGIFHLNPWQFIAAFLIGLVIGWLYYKTKSLWPGLFIHFANNTFSFLLAKKYQDINIGFNDLAGSTENYLLLLMGSIIIGLIILYVTKIILNNQSQIQTINKNKGFNHEQ